MAITEVSYSSFLRGPSEVLPALEHGDVQLDRRDAEPLVMTRAHRYRSWMQGMALSSRVIRHLLKEDPDLAENLLANELPWLQWLPKSEQMDCLGDILTQLAAGAETGTFEPFARAITEWEHTAEVWADPHLAKRFSSDFAGDGDVIRRPKVRQ